ncbi:MAG: hypothetical protein KF726_08135 [Anaerolineae bacterium]|nr:hypothetical protein [Anaerolineae bacterium]
MTRDMTLLKTATPFNEVSQQLEAIASKITDIAAQLEAGTLVGAPTPTNQPLPDVLRDRLLFNVVQMRDKLREVSSAAYSQAHPHYDRPPITQIDTLAAVFKAFDPYFDAALTKAEVRKALRRVLEQYPAEVSRSLLLEHRLKADQPQVDLSLLLDPALDRGREWLAANASGVTRDFCAAWAEAESLLNQAVETAWLEIDIPLAVQPITAPEPSVFFRLKEDADQSAIEAGLKLLNPEAGALRRVQACLDALPAGGSVRWAGVMARKSRNVRLCLDLPKESIKLYLQGLGWQGDAEQLDLLVAGFTKLTDLVIVAIELTPAGMLNTLGFECRYQFNRQPEIEPRWSALLAMLVKARLCSEEKQSALLNWNGVFHEPFDIDGKAQILVRNLSHVKIGFEPGVAVTAKAYISCNVRDFKATR